MTPCLTLNGFPEGTGVHPLVFHLVNLFYKLSKFMYQLILTLGL